MQQQLLLVLLLISCFHSNFSDFLLVSDRYDLRGLSLTNGSLPDVISPISGLTRAMAVDYLAETEELVWSDIYTEKISITNKNGTNQRTLIEKLSYPEGLAVDWIGKNVYFTDNGLDIIGVVGIDQKFSRVLIDSQLEKPLGIAVDPTAGFMYWTDFGSSPKIERATMGGRNRQTIVSSGLYWPLGLYLDIAGKRLYWVEDHLAKIESSNVDGSGRKVIVSISGYRAFGLTKYGSYLYWTDWLSDVVYKTTIKDKKSVLHAKLKWSAFGITIYDKTRKGGINGCSINKGKCDQLCLPESSSSYVCACSYGFLQSDNQTCARPENYLLVADINSVRGLAIDTLFNALEPIADLTRAIAIDYDPFTDDIYYTDVVLETIVKISLKTGARKTIVSSLSVPDGIAIDWIGQNIFYTDTGLDRIGMARMDGSGHIIVITVNLNEPRGIALDLERGMMYWTDWGTLPKIEKAQMDGVGRKTIVSGNLGWPNGITLDTKSQILYWVDAKLDRVEKCTFDGLSRTLLSSPINNIHPYGLAFDGNYLYWTDWNARSILRLPVSGGNHSIYATPFPRLSKPSGLVLHDPKNRKAVRNACSTNNGNCSEFCIAVPNGLRRCACSVSNSLNCIPRILSGPMPITVNKFESVVLQCLIAGETKTGVSLLTVKWHKDGKTLRTEYGGSLSDIVSLWTISSATKSDEGVYQCTATNKYGPTVSSAALLSVADDQSTAYVSSSVASVTSQVLTTSLLPSNSFSSDIRPTSSLVTTTGSLLTPSITTKSSLQIAPSSQLKPRSSPVMTAIQVSMPSRNAITEGPVDVTKLMPTEPIRNQEPTERKITENVLALTEPSDKEFQTSDGLNMGFYIGFAVLGVAVLVCIALVVILPRKKNRSEDNPSTESPPEQCTIQNKVFRPDSLIGEDSKSNFDEPVYCTIEEQGYCAPYTKPLPTYDVLPSSYQKPLSSNQEQMSATSEFYVAMK